MMNPYISTLSKELINRHIDCFSEENLIKAVQKNLSEINSEKDKLDLLTSILEANDVSYQNHLKVCRGCGREQEHIKINYFLQQELAVLSIVVTDNFTREEKEKCNEELNKILQKIINSNELIQDNIEILRREIEELKTLYVLGKKNWKQQFAGKMTDMVYSGVISEMTAKPIIENILKPSFNFITGLLT